MNGGQEQRAFWAILLAMAVLLVWSVAFPPPQPPERPIAEEKALPPGDVTTLREAPGPGPEEPWDEPPAPSPGGASGSLLGVSGGDAGLRRAEDATGERVQVRVDGPDLSLEFDGRGARITAAFLHGFMRTEGRSVQLLPQNGLGALGSVLVVGSREVPLDQFVFELVSDTRTSEGRRLVWQLRLEELTLQKTFTVPPEGNLIEVEHEILEDRVGLAGWGVSWAGGMRVTEEQRGNVRGANFHGSVFAEGKVQRKDANHFRKGPQEYSGHTYFITSQNRYFVGAIVPRGDHQGPAKLWQVTTGRDQPPSVGGEILVERAPGLAANRVEYDVYIGPLDYAGMSALDLGIEGAVDLGSSWIRPLSRAILSILIWMHGIIPNYGVVIVLFSSMVNLLFFPLTYKSTRSMRDMAALKPRLDALKEKHKDEPQKLSEATMRLYKEAGVNPLGGCLPLLLQMPIFFALYAVLFHTIELRQAPFVFWIHDLSQPDVVFNLPFSLPLIGSGVALLPIIMGVTSYFQSKATMVDPSQKMMVTLMPIMMTFIFFTMPSGLVLYWLTSNLFTIAQKFMMKPSAVAVAVADTAPTPAKPGGGKKKGDRTGTKKTAKGAKAGAKS